MLPQRNVEKRRRRFEQVPVLCRASDADDIHPLAVQLHATADGIGPAPESSGHRFVDDRHERPAFVVGAREFAARHERDAHRLQIAGSDFVVLGRWLLVGRSLVAIDGNRAGRITPVRERCQARKRSRLDTAERFETVDQFVLKSSGSLPIVAGREQIHRGGENSVRGKPRAGVTSILQASNEQYCSDEENETQRHLDEHQHRSDPGAAARADDGARLRAQRTGQIDAGGEHGRDERE